MLPFIFILVLKRCVFQGSFGKSNDEESHCEEREISYNEVIYDEIMQCKKITEQKCFQVQQTTFNVYKVCLEFFISNI